MVLWSSQRLPELNPSNIPADIKMQEAAGVADALAQRYLADDKSKAAVKQLSFGRTDASLVCLQPNWSSQSLCYGSGQRP